MAGANGQWAPASQRAAGNPYDDSKAQAASNLGSWGDLIAAAVDSARTNAAAQADFYGRLGDNTATGLHAMANPGDLTAQQAATASSRSTFGLSPEMAAAPTGGRVAPGQDWQGSAGVYKPTDDPKSAASKVAAVAAALDKTKPRTGKGPKGAAPVAPVANTPDVPDAGLAELKKMVSDYAGQDQEINLAPLIALVDSWTGSQMGKGYQQPEGPEEHAKKVMDLRMKVLGHEADLNDKKQARADMLADRVRHDKEHSDDQAVRWAQVNATRADSRSTKEAAAAEKAAKDDEQFDGKMVNQWKGGLTEIAKLNGYGGPSNPDDPKAAERQISRAHEQVKHFADWAIQDAKDHGRPVPKRYDAYRDSLNFLLGKPTGADGAAAGQKRS